MAATERPRAYSSLFDANTGNIHGNTQQSLASLLRQLRPRFFDLIVDPQGDNREEGVHTTIQGALNAAAPGAVIGVTPGTYVENLVLADWTAAAKDGIKLVAAVPGAEVVIAPAAGIAIEFTGTATGSANLHLVGITVQGFAGSAPIDNTPAAGTPVVVVHYGTDILGNTAVAGAAASFSARGGHFEVLVGGGLIVGTGSTGAARLSTSNSATTGTWA
jgi:hypothetical protein